MPHRKRQRASAVTPGVQILFGLVGVAVATPLLSAVHKAGSAIGTLVVAILLVAAILSGAQLLAKKHIQRRVKNVVLAAIKLHEDALVRRRMQLLGLDPYGAVVVDRWSKEIDRFIEGQIVPKLSARQHQALRQRYTETVLLLEERVAQAAAERPACLPENATPAEFEAFCAEQLRQCGWDAHVTKASRDQGVDVIAAKDGVRLVLQCKLYSKPVGNKAVQEAAAGRSHEGAQYAAVVSNRSFTAAAEELARTNGVLLLHYSQLREIDRLIM